MNHFLQICFEEVNYDTTVTTIYFLFSCKYEINKSNHMQYPFSFELDYMQYLQLKC